MKPVWEYLTTKKQWKEYLKDLLHENDDAVKKAILMIYARQTEVERQKGKALEDNNIGFTQHDAKEMSILAVKLQRGEELTVGEMAKSKNKMAKYWRQLMEISIEQMKQEERKTDEQRALEESYREERKKEKAKEQFELSIRIMQRCAEEGISCDYGICDECPVTQGLQMRLKFKEAEG